MDPNTPDVKRRRRYDSSRRAVQAARTRDAVVDTARALFLRDGYAATTVSAIAATADVSVETVYKAFGGKPGLVRAIVRAGLEGEGDIPAETRSDALHRTESDPRTIIRGWGRLACEVAPRVAPVLLLLRDAATDLDVLRLKAHLEESRLVRMTHNAEALAIAGHLRTGVSVQYAAEVMWTYSSPQLYELLVVERGWPVTRYGDFICEAMIAALLPSPGDSRPEPA